MSLLKNTFYSVIFFCTEAVAFTILCCPIILCCFRTIFSAIVLICLSLSPLKFTMEDENFLLYRRLYRIGLFFPSFMQQTYPDILGGRQLIPRSHVWSLHAHTSSRCAIFRDSHVCNNVEKPTGSFRSTLLNQNIANGRNPNRNTF